MIQKYRLPVLRSGMPGRGGDGRGGRMSIYDPHIGQAGRSMVQSLKGYHITP
jgi:hypothetical protein